MAGATGQERSAAEVAAIAARFRSVLQRAIYLLGLEAIAAVGGGIAILATGLATGPWAVASLLVWFLLVAGLAILSYVNWRCPACGSYLGRGPIGFLKVDRCPACGTRLI